MSFDEYFKDELLPQPTQQPSAGSSTPKAIDGKGASSATRTRCPASKP